MRAKARRMLPAWVLGLGLGVALGFGLTSVEARAQSTTSGTASSSLINPMMYPLMTGQQMTAGTAAYFLLNANQQNGGLGSGALSGGGLAGGGGGMMGQTQAGAQLNNLTSGGRRRSGVGPLTQAAPPMRATSNTPGAGASKYFARQFPSNAEPNRFYGRQNRQFPNIGR